MFGSSPSALPKINKPAIARSLSLVAAALASAGTYLAVSASKGHFGFPLDDSWIHQTYARNLVRLAEWSFIPGEPSGGSTSPLWTILLTPGQLSGSFPLGWTFLLGGVIFLCLARVIDKAVPPSDESKFKFLPWAGFLILFEWHFTWSAVSGMETLLHGLVILVFALLSLRERPSWLVLGLLVGVSVWVRPDGITLLGPGLLLAFLVERDLQRRATACMKFLIGLLLLAIPYALFNHALSGQLLPTTFFAKQMEYAAWQERSIISRLADTLINFLTGPAIFLLPGVMLFGSNAWKRKEWGAIGMLIWLVGYVILYALRLPPYQHARYLIPAMPVFLLFGLKGLIEFLQKTNGKGRATNLLRFAWLISLVLTSAGFWWNGARAYQEDVAFVETEMVTTSRWVADNLPAEALVAAHDIGALGYFDNHRLVDLAGLISPEVIPMLGDESQISDYLNESQVTHLIVFPDWYPTLTSNLQKVYTSEGQYAPAMGGTNMAVYLWNIP